ncbi:hypothetical protein ACS0TY_015820 [Phlomoides rotata]
MSRLNCRAEEGGEMSRQRGKSTKNGIAYFTEGIEDVQGHSIFGRYSEVEMLAELKALAMDPSSPQFAQDNIQPLWNQIVMLRKVMCLKDSEIPWRKRKLEQFVKDKLIAPADFALPNQQKKPKLSRKQFSHASSVACFLSRTSSSLVTFDDALPEKQIATACSFIDDVADKNYPLKDISQTVDSDESVYGSIHPISLPISDGARRKHSGTPRRSPRILNFIGDHLQRKVIPVGPRFQATIPEWNGPEDRSTLIDAYKSNSDCLKWLGSRVWPVENNKTRISDKNVGEGRHSSCCCVSPGSADCTKHHISDERLLLLRDLGPAFSIWKIDQMGEQVSESWSLNEQQTFESLMKKRPPSNTKSFWKRVLKSFSNKSRADIANYYFNVYIPRRMSLHTRSPSIKQIDTDDEDEADDSKARYLRSG